MLTVGLTGGIGSGKTTVAKVFQALKIPVYFADKEARKFMDEDTIKESLRKSLANNVFLPDGKIDRAKLAAEVFNNYESLMFLNSLIHPLVRKDFQQWKNNFPDAPYVMGEAAILYESGFYRDFSKIIAVTAPEHERIERVMKRDKITHEEVEKRMKSQWKDEEKCAKADFIIYNRDNQLILPQIEAIHRQLLSIR